MKKLFSCSMLLFFMMFINVSASDVKGIVPNDMCVDDAGNIYLAYGAAIYIRDESSKMVHFQNVHGNIRSISYESNKLYVASEHDGALVTIIGIDGTIENYITLKDNGHILDLSVSDESICYIYQDEWDNHHLIIFDMIKGSEKTVDEIDNPMYLSTANGSLLVTCTEYGSPVLVIIDLCSYQISIIKDRPPLGNIHLEPSRNECLISSDDQFTCITWEEGVNKSEPVNGRIPLNSIWDANQNNIYIYNYPENRVVIINKNDCIINKKELVIAGVDLGAGYYADVERAMEIFHSTNPNYKITIRSYSSIDNLIIALMSNREQIDLLVLDNFNYIYFAKSGVLSDLRQYDQVVQLEQTGQFRNWVFKIAENYGELYALPYEEIFLTLWSCDATILKNSNIKMPNFDWTWNDFLEIAEKCKDDNIVVFTDWREITNPPFLVNYINTFVNPIMGVSVFDTEYFRNICNIWNQCLQDDIITEESYMQESLFSEIYITAMSELDPEHPIIYPPHLGINRVIDAEVGLIGLNEYGSNKEVALAFLEVYYSKDLAHLSNLILFNDLQLYRLEGFEESPAYTSNLFIEALDRASPRDEIASIRKAATSALYGFFINANSIDVTIKNIESAVDLILNE